MTRLFAVAALLVLTFAGTARADRIAADRCAATLPPVSRTIYNNSLPGVLRGELPADAIKSVTRSMVMSGALPRADARPAAEAAGGCMRLLR